MAVVARATIAPADQVAHDQLDQSVESAIARRGGPPDGLMVHLAYPSGEGFEIVEVWRSEDAFRASWNDVVEPALAEVGLTASAPEVNPVWSVARP
jgi:hypothetical protein